MHQMINDTELEHDPGSEEEILLEPEKNETFKLETNHSEVKSSEKSINQSSSHLRSTGNIQNDIINLMSLKPDQFQFSFTGLRRYLGIHQQQLVNTIDRLLEDSILHKTQGGYFLSPQYRKEGNNLIENWSECEHWIGKKLYPTPITIQKLYKKLFNKWFGKNRFLGGINDFKNDKIVLDWVDMNNSEAKTRLEVSSSKAEVKFKFVSVFERDKALNVFSEIFISTDNPIMFEYSNSFINN